MPVSRLALKAYGLALLVIVLDQLTKAWMISGLDLREVGQIPVLGSFFRFSWVENRGVSFGLFGDGSARWVLSVFSIGVAVALAWWVARQTRPLMGTAIGLVMGGAVGNVIDRVRFGYVVDFLDFSGTGLFPWVFNVADSAITIGVLLLLIDSWQSERQAKVGGTAETS
jgi:lipoprotein signal peptidase